jgi:hypothetical protein
MYFNLKIYTPIDFNTLHIYIFFKIFTNFEIIFLKVLKKEKAKPGYM